VKNGYLTVGIDATNLRRGGGRTHLIELLRYANPKAFGFSRVVVWGGRSTLSLLDEKPWLEKVNLSVHERGLLTRSLWQHFRLSRVALEYQCDILFVPGGSFSGNFHPIVTMSQNMLPFEWNELFRYRWSLLTLKLILLRVAQTRSFLSADGVIFLTKYARKTVKGAIGKLPNSRIIPHGINDRFFMPPRVQKCIDDYNSGYHILYVSIVDQYKHQWHVVDAVDRLRNQTGWNIKLDLVGPAYPPAYHHLQSAISNHDPDNEWVKYHGMVNFDMLHTIYAQADLGIFASSCENLPNILLETMASGLPIASSNKGPMREILKDYGVYFNPEQPDDIIDALKVLISDLELRIQYAKSSFMEAKKYTWVRCADDTFEFLSNVYHQKY